MTSESILIDDARLADVPALAELLALLFEQEVEMRVDRAKQLSGLEQMLAAPNVGRIFVARESAGGRPLGMVSLLFTISTAEGGAVSWLEDLVVQPAVRGRGIGTRLLGHAIDFAGAAGHTRIMLHTDASNFSAQALYARHGFTASTMHTMKLGLGD
jgi:GNAT superfamily N-acetyltransferase